MFLVIQKNVKRKEKYMNILFAANTHMSEQEKESFIIMQERNINLFSIRMEKGDGNEMK